MHPIHKIVDFQIKPHSTLLVTFNDGTNKIFNISPILKGEMYGPLSNQSYFEKAFLDTEVNTITWPNGADFDPEVLYNWEKYVVELTERANNWSA